MSRNARTHRHQERSTRSPATPPSSWSLASSQRRTALLINPHTCITLQYVSTPKRKATPKSESPKRTLVRQPFQVRISSTHIDKLKTYCRSKGYIIGAALERAIDGLVAGAK